MKNCILLTFDLEEFDLPLEFGCPISEEEQINVTNIGVQKIIGLLSKYDIKATFFATAFYAERDREVIRSISLTHEIASHSNKHSEVRADDPSVSKSVLEKITGKQVNGFRMPRFGGIDRMILKSAGYKYDSSVNPTFIPGRYNNLFMPRKYFTDKGSEIIVLPISVSPVIRFPLFWISFKNLPLSFYLFICKQTLRKDSYLHLYFHPWEFEDLDRFKIPGYLKSVSGDKLLGRLERLIVNLKNANDFSTVSGFLDSNL